MCLQLRGNTLATRLAVEKSVGEGGRRHELDEALVSIKGRNSLFDEIAEKGCSFLAQPSEQDCERWLLSLALELYRS